VSVPLGSDQTGQRRPSRKAETALTLSFWPLSDSTRGLDGEPRRGPGDEQKGGSSERCKPTLVRADRGSPGEGDAVGPKIGQPLSSGKAVAKAVVYPNDAAVRRP